MEQARGLSGIGRIASMIRLRHVHNIGKLMYRLLGTRDHIRDSIQTIIPSLTTFLERVCQFGRTETADAAS